MNKMQIKRVVDNWLYDEERPMMNKGLKNIEKLRVICNNLLFFLYFCLSKTRY